MVFTRDTKSEDLIEQNFRALAELYADSTRELRRGCAKNDRFTAIKEYNDIDTLAPTKKLLDEYQDYIDSLDSIEDKQKAAGHFLFLCKDNFYGLGWKAAKSFTDYIALKSPLSDRDKISYLLYLLEIIDPQKEENKDKKKNNLHPLELSSLKKLAEFQLVSEERKNIDNIFVRLKTYLDSHNKYAPYIYYMMQYFANNIQTVNAEDISKFSEIYFKSMANTVKNKKNKDVKINLIILNKLIAKEGNSKVAIEGFIKVFADYFKNTGPNELNAYLCSSIGELIKNKAQGYSVEEQKELQQVWLNNCPLKKRWEANTEALSFLNQIGPEILMPEKIKKTNDNEIEEFEFDETIKDKLWSIENITYTNSSDYVDTNDYVEAEKMVDLTIREKVNSIYYDVQVSDNPKEKSWEIADAYNQLVNSSFRKNNVLDKEMVNMFSNIIDYYDFTPEDVYDLLQHINNKSNERSKHVALTIKKGYQNSGQKVRPHKKERNSFVTPDNQLRLNL